MATVRPFSGGRSWVIGFSARFRPKSRPETPEDVSVAEEQAAVPAAEEPPAATVDEEPPVRHQLRQQR